MIGYTMVGTGDLPRALGFYDPLERDEEKCARFSARIPL
jgi:hypothetical protein